MLIRKIAKLLLVLLIVFPLVGSEDDPYRISLGSVSFTPTAGQVYFKQRGHFIIQFNEIPSAEQLHELSKKGVDIQRYIGGTAYVARGQQTLEMVSLLHRDYVRAAIDITPAMRLHPAFGYSAELQKAIRNNELVSVDVRFHEDVPFEKAVYELHSFGIVCNRDRFLADNRLIIKAPWPSIQCLCDVDEVDTIHPALLDVSLLNRSAAKRMRVEKILNKPKYRSPSGEGVLVGVTDAWVVDQNHVEFDNRVTILHDANSIETPDDPGNLSHATAVAGSIASSGINKPKSRGTAPNAQILSLLIPFDPVDEIQYAAEKFGMRISCNSWSYSPLEDEFYPPVRLSADDANFSRGKKTKYGYTHNFIDAMDKMVRKADVLYIWAAGNDSSTIVLIPWPDELGKTKPVDAWHRANPGYDTLTVNSNAKNILAIGATHKDDYITNFSSHGPQCDGRLAPHLVAPGYNLFIPGPDNTYGLGQGTSGSAPLVAGVSALLLQQYKSIQQTEPSSALLKAILINSARDLGLKGPDYTYGYGMVDAELAARTISGQEGVEEISQVSSRFIEDTIKNKETHTYTFEVTNTKKELRITLVWHDPPGRRLVNNLDLWAHYGSEKKILPLTLNPEKPQEEAVEKRNKRDTTEQIVIEDPQPGTWTVSIKGHKVPKGPQAYALVLAAGKGNQAPVRKDKGDFTIERVFSSLGDVNQPDYDFNIGDPLYLHALISVHENASYKDGYYGTVSSRFEFRDDSGELAFDLGWSWDNMAPTKPGEFRDVQMRAEEIPEGVPKGTYRVRTIVSMHNGVTKITSQEFLVTIH